MDFLEFFLLIDKQKHIIVSLLLVIMIFLIRWLLKLHKNNYYTISYAIRDTILIGIAKEIIDLFWFGNPQITDLLADSIGIFLPLYAYFLIKNLNSVKWHDFYRYEWDLARYTFHNLYRVYFDIKNILKTKIKKALFWGVSVSIKKLKEENYILKDDFYDFWKTLKYFFILEFVWAIDFIKFIFKLPIISFFWTFWLLLSPIQVLLDNWQNKKDI